MAAPRSSRRRLRAVASLAFGLSWWLPTVAGAAPGPETAPAPAPAPAAEAETAPAPAPETALAPETAPAPAPAASEPAPDRDPGGFTSGFDDLDEDEDDDLGDEDDDFGDEGDAEPGAAAVGEGKAGAGTTSSAQLTTIPGAARTLEPPVIVGPSGNPRHKWVYSGLLALRYNPLGAGLDIKTGHRLQVIDRPGVLFRDSYLLTGVRTFLTPAFARVGPHVEFQPLAVLNLYAGYNFIGWFGNFNLLQSFKSPTSPYSDSVLKHRHKSYRTIGQVADLSALLQMKLGPLAARSNLVFYWTNMNLKNGDRVWYDPFMDVLMAKKGWGMTLDTDLVYFFKDSGLKLGVRHSMVHAFYRTRDFQPGEPVDSLRHVNSPHHRIGPAVLYTFYDRPEQRFNKPTVALLTQWFIQHRYRTGQDVSQAIPQVVLALTFEGDLFPHPQRRQIDRTGRQRRKRENMLERTDMPPASKEAR